MRRGTLFWGTVLILAGFLILLDNLNIISVNVWDLLWPIFLVGLGVWILFGTVMGRRGVEAEHANIPLEGAARARLQVNHGAGRLRIYSGAGNGDVVQGDFAGGLGLRTHREGDLLDVEMSIPAQSFPFGPWNWGPHGLDWSVGVNREIPISLRINSGAGEANIDLSDLQVNDLRMQTGASSSIITLPAAAGHTRANIEAGAASVSIIIPAGVAARIRDHSGLSSVSIDRQRFPRQGEYYQSPDFEPAVNKVELEIKAGVGSVDIR